MRAIVARTTTPRYLWTASAGRIKRDAGWGPGGILGLSDDTPAPTLPLPGHMAHLVVHLANPGI